jgi:hypothetical protein
VKLRSYGQNAYANLAGNANIAREKLLDAAQSDTATYLIKTMFSQIEIKLRQLMPIP